MVIVDTALQKREADGNPIRVGMIGAGFMGRGIVLHIAKSVPGMELVAIANRSLDAAFRAYNEAGITDVSEAGTVADVEHSVAKGQYAVAQDPMLICEAEGIDVVIEVTGAIEYAAEVVLKAIEFGKHVVMMNAELDGTLGPILKVYADKAGVVITNTEGDQPGVIMNLYRFVQGLGVKPVLCGNIKGLQDPYRNPTTQEAFAKQWKQKAHMVTSFADGSKISFEQGIVANATGMRVAKLGMFGPEVEAGTSVMEASSWYPFEELVNGPGIVDYVVRAEPGPGVFVLGTCDDPTQQHYLNLYKLGEGPLYCFYTPYHLCHFEVYKSVARAVLFNDPTITPLGAPAVDVVTTAKIGLKAGQVIDGIGYYMTYGQCQNANITLQDNLLPLGLAEGCVLKRDIPKDHVLTYDDVDVPQGRLCDRLRAEQNEVFKKDLDQKSVA